MIVRKLSEVKGTEREVSATGWISHRLLLKHEKMGFSMHDTTIVEGAELHLHYKNHLEAVYCVAGKGTVEVVGTGKTYEIEDGTIYALDQHDKHILRAEKEMRMICVFNPPLTGAEVHDETGAYPADPDAAAG